MSVSLGALSIRSVDTLYSGMLLTSGMNASQAKLGFYGKASIFILSGLLFLQLSGLTCIQDAWASPFSGSDVDVAAAVGNPSPEPLPASGDGSGGSLHHDCPCHHLISLPTVTIESETAPGTSIVPVSFSVPEDLPQILFHPPLL